MATPSEPDDAAQPDDTGSPVPRGAGSSRPQRSGNIRILTVTGWVLLAAAVLGVVWIGVTGLIARHELNQVRAELPQLRTALTSGDLSGARTIAGRIETHAHRAHSLTTGPAWWTASSLPGIGAPLRTSRVLSSAADQVGQQVLPGVVQLAQQLDTTSHTGSTSVDLTALARLSPVLTDAAHAAHAVTLQVNGTSGSWLGYVSSARNSVATQLDELDGDLTGADRAVHIMVPMLGQNGPKRYFIGFLNEAESRGVGGIPGAFAIATANHGHITFDRFGSDDDLQNVRADVDLGANFNAQYKQDDPTGVIQNSDLSPDFRYAAQIWAGMWQRKTGEHIDGAIAIDPTALSYLLAVTGPAQVPGNISVGAGNVVELTQSGQYVRYPGTSTAEINDRKAFLNGVAKGVSERLVSVQGPQHLVEALSRSARERRLVVYSADPAVERNLVAANWAGAVDPSPGRSYSGFVVNNAAGSKLDFYLKRTMTYRRDCSSGGAATATFTLTNGAPKSGLPPYVTYRADKPHGTKPGDTRVLVTYYADISARITRATLDGRAISVTESPGLGTVSVTLDVELPAGATRRVVVTVAEPAGDGSVQVLRQPGVNPMNVDVSDSRC